MSGAPFLGDSPAFQVDTSLGTTIEQYQLIQISALTENNSMLAGLCATAATQRIKACGVAFTPWQVPPDPRLYEPASKPSTDISYAFDTEKYEHLSVRQEGYTWIKVEIPAGGSTITLAVGDWLIPSVQAAGGVEPRPASGLTAAYHQTNADVENTEDRIIVGRAYSLIHIPESTPDYGNVPSLQSGTAVATLTAITNLVTSGFVFAKLGKG